MSMRFRAAAALARLAAREGKATASATADTAEEAGGEA